MGYVTVTLSPRRVSGLVSKILAFLDMKLREIIDAAGPDVDEWKPGERVGVGWHGGHCGRCERCRRGDFVLCERALVPGISYDGGYAEYMVAPVEALARIPDDLSDAEAAPCFAPVSPPSAHFATAVRGPARWPPSSALADSGISVCNLRPRWALQR